MTFNIYNLVSIVSILFVCVYGIFHNVEFTMEYTIDYMSNLYMKITNQNIGAANHNLIKSRLFNRYR